MTAPIFCNLSTPALLVDNLRDNPIARKSKLLFLVTDAFGGHGGIAQFNRDFIEAIIANGSFGEIDVIPRLITARIGKLPESLDYDEKAATGKVRFVKRALAQSFSRVDVVVCGHLHLLPIAWPVARAQRAHLTLIIHGIEAWQPAQNLFSNYLARRVDEAIAVSHYSAERFSDWSRLADSRIRILPNCVDLDRFIPREADQALLDRYGLRGSNVILTIGRLASKERRKGFDEVIAILPQLLSRFPNVKYLIGGDGPDMPRLQQEAAARGVSHAVIFAGHVTESEKVAHYSIADAFVMPSAGEGFGIVLIEAASCGVPVIGSQADGSREALRNGSLGTLIDPEQPNQLLEAVTKVLEQPQKHVRNPAVEMFSVPNFQARVAEWIEDCASIPSKAEAGSSFPRALSVAAQRTNEERDPI
jgi:phosphatidylinositol alpha-1,6-mannosyltransferase